MTATLKHIERIYDSRANLRSSLDAMQIAIESDNSHGFVWKDNSGTPRYYSAAIQNYFDGASTVYVDNEMGNVTAHGDFSTTQYLKWLTNSTYRVGFSSGHISGEMEGTELFDFHLNGFESAGFSYSDSSTPMVSYGGVDILNNSGAVSFRNSSTLTSFLDADATSISKTTVGVSRQTISSTGFILSVWDSGGGVYNPAASLTWTNKKGNLILSDYLGNGKAISGTDSTDIWTGLTTGTAFGALAFYENNQALTDRYQSLNGFKSRTTSTITCTGGTFTIAPTGSTFDVFVAGIKYTKTAETVSITNDNTQHYVYYDAGGTLTVSTTAWDITSDAAPVATVWKNGTSYRVGEERHDAERDRNDHKSRHKTFGAQYDALRGGGELTIDSVSFQIGAMSVWDEDIENYFAAQTTCLVWYRNTGSLTMKYDTAASSVLARVSGGALYYDNAGTLATVDNGKYVKNWVYGTNDKTIPVYCVTGQAQYSTEALATNSPAPSFPGVTTQEWKLLYTVVWKNASGTPTYVSAQDYRLSGSSPVGSVSTIPVSSVIGTATLVPFFDAANKGTTDSKFYYDSSGKNLYVGTGLYFGTTYNSRITESSAGLSYNSTGLGHNFGQEIIAPDITVSTLTYGRIPYATTGGKLIDNTALSYTTAGGINVNLAQIGNNTIRAGYLLDVQTASTASTAKSYLGVKIPSTSTAGESYVVIGNDNNSARLWFGALGSAFGTAVCGETGASLNAIYASNGSLVIGTTSTAAVNINSNSNRGISVTASTIEMSTNGGSGSTKRLTISSAGFVGIGTISPTFDLHIEKSAASVTMLIKDTLSTGRSGFNLGTDTGNNSGFFSYGSTYTDASNYEKPDGIALVSGYAGGASIAAQNAAGVIRFYTAGTTDATYLRAKIDAAGLLTTYKDIANTQAGASSITTANSSAAITGGIKTTAGAGALVKVGSFSASTDVDFVFNDTTKAKLTINGLLVSNLTSGRITFAGSSGLLTDSANLVWDESNARLGIGAGAATPLADVHVERTNNGLTALRIGNVNTGVSARVGFTFNSSEGNGISAIIQHGGSYTTSGLDIAGQMTVNGGGAGGLLLHASNAAGILRFGTNGTICGSVSSAGLWRIGDATAPATYALTVAGSINMTTGNVLRINGTQVVQARISGWALPTATLARTTFDPASVTLVELAKRVAALITDLYSTHGLIGA